MKIEDLLARADIALHSLMPPGSASLVTAIDPSLGYPKNLVKVLLRLRPADVLLDDPPSRTQLLMLLHHTEARELATNIGCPLGQDYYAFLISKTFSRGTERLKLYSFFGVEIPNPERRELAPSQTDINPSFGLFPHQSRALRKAEEYLGAEPHRALLHMPTGSGKTRTAMNIVCNYLRTRDSGVVIWLAHSEELCEQAAEEFAKAWTSLGSRPVPLTRFWGSYDTDLRTIKDGIVVAGLKKIVSKLRADDYQLRSISARNPFVVMDEAHQAIAPTYQIIIDLLLRPMSDSRLLGLSATPGRTWNDPSADRELAQFFGSRKVTLKIDGHSNPVDYLISNQYLAEPKYTLINSSTAVTLNDVELSKVRETFELPNSVLDRLAADEQRNLLIVHHAEQLLKRHRRVILFAASVQQSDVLAAVLAARGHWAYSISSKSTNNRSSLIESFKDSDDTPKILCNFGVLTTGFDAPRTSAALIARPTLSLVLYSQMVGRAMRGLVAGGNRNCEILTVVDPTLPGFDSVATAFSNWEDVWSNQDE
jgi:superfamily II DNA or RNA helicase